MTVSSAKQFWAAQWLHATAPLWWLQQAALLALAVSRLQAGGGLTAMLQPAAGIVLLGLLRASCEAWSAARLFDNAREQLTMWRAEAMNALAARSPLDRQRIPAGAAASFRLAQRDVIRTDGGRGSSPRPPRSQTTLTRTSLFSTNHTRLWQGAVRLALLL
ncbi:hypothetical protein QRD40_05295 [Comamonas sp. Y6]|uniref:ABC transmembrane type-1 domain-containing protein n=1 Tax=Comamonas resistens TaxID=3046670 RepID=A0ABY8SQY6_9BURK|nr:hypothetical protein [Comamonas resistens]MDL5035761.1 hypothetical protein [Comamonas resistens]WHS65175.1 hypothetical protein QMY55_22265 [Comamonas resistens]